MLTLNKELLFIRVNRYEYLLKKGTISNYSFTILDEEELGFLTILFEKLTYPMAEDKIVKELKQTLGMTTEKIKDILSELKESDILIKNTKSDIPSICVLAPNEIKEQIKQRLAEVIKSDIKVKDLQQVNYSDITEELIVLFLPYYSPTILHEVDEYCTQAGKKLFITYIDGDEGIVLPLVSNDGLSYNDYEIMRESALYNLLDYQVMKEHLIAKKAEMKIQDFKWEYILMSSLLIFKQHLEETMINSFVYSIDTERFIFTKSKLFRFPKNSLSQSDVNIKHPFI